MSHVGKQSMVIQQPIAFVSDKLQRRHYRRFTRRFDDVRFLNYGYETNPPMRIPLGAEDEPDRYPIQLYHATASQGDMSGDVLEVGCGHGGGASYLARTFRPRSYTGLDLNPEAIASNQAKHQVGGLRFVQGDAEALPFDEGSFDAVINVESSIHYPHFGRFLAEVARVLRPGGCFLYADGRFKAHIPAWEAALEAAPMQMLSSRVINDEVVRGLEANSARWEALSSRSRLMMAGCQCVRGSLIHRKLKRGKFSYRMYCLTR